MMNQSVNKLNPVCLKRYRMLQEIFMRGSMPGTEHLDIEELSKRWNHQAFPNETFVMNYLMIGAGLNDEHVEREFLLSQFLVSKMMYHVGVEDYNFPLAYQLADALVADFYYRGMTYDQIYQYIRTLKR